MKIVLNLQRVSVSLNQLCQDGIHRGPYAQGVEQSASRTSAVYVTYSGQGQGSWLRHGAKNPEGRGFDSRWFH